MHNESVKLIVYLHIVGKIIHKEFLVRIIRIVAFHKPMLTENPFGIRVNNKDWFSERV